jgi:hypothetical protein
MQRWTKFAGFMAGVILAASTSVVAQPVPQTGPTFPITSADPIISAKAAVGSGGTTIDPGKPRKDILESSSIQPLSGDVGAGQ